MGQKVNPIGLRVSTNHNWDSVWFDKKDYAKKLVNDIKLRNHISKNYANAGISKVIIERPADNKVNVTIKTAKPGVLIGKKGADIDKIKKEVEKIAGLDVNIKILEVDKPNSDATIVAQNIAKQIENRISFRRAMKKAIQSSMRFGVKGIKVSCAGRLGGAEIARTEWYKEGSVPLHTIRNNIDYATANAYTTYGVIGIKVWLYKD
ncbi:30S ribosomal protein S3 [Pseudomonadota bacterium]